MAESDLRRSVAEPVPVPTLVLSLHHRCPLSWWGVGRPWAAGRPTQHLGYQGCHPTKGSTPPGYRATAHRRIGVGLGTRPLGTPRSGPGPLTHACKCGSHYITEETAGGGERHARVTSYQNLQAPSPEPSLEHHSPAAVTRLLLMHGTSGPHYWGHTQAGSRRCLQGACETAARMTPGAGTAHTPRVRGG